MTYDYLKVKEYKHWTIFLHPNQYYLGRSYVWANRENAIDFLDTNEDEKAEFFVAATQLKQSLIRLFQPDLFNYAALGNVAPHLHVHLIPRYRSIRQFFGYEFKDQRWGMNYAPYDKTFTLTDEVLIEIKKLLQSEM